MPLGQMFLRRFSTRAPGHALDPIRPEDEQIERIARVQAPFEEPRRIVGSRSPSNKSPRLRTPEPPTTFAVGEVADAPINAPKQASIRDIQRQLEFDTPLTADDFNEYRRQQSRTLLHSRDPSDSSGPSFLSNSKHFVVEQGTFVDASYKSFGSTESVAFQFFRKRIARNALHNSADRFDPPLCDEDTRSGLINEIKTWIDDPKTPSQIAIITGPAGSGKSAIQQTICETYAARNMLAGSFFFSAGDSSRNKHHSLFTTLVYQIAQTNKDLRPFIEQAVKDDPAVFDRSLEAQVSILLIDSFQAAASSCHREHLSKQWPRLLVVDGVDECKGEEMQLHLLQVISKCFVQSKLPLKIILASRPEYGIRTALKTFLNSAYHIKLDKYSATSDIKLFLRRRLRALGAASNDPRANSNLWPTDLIVDKLADNSSGQFVYAATVVKYASNRRFSPYLRIQQVLAWEPAIEQRKNPFAALDALYLNILLTAETAYRDDSEDVRSVIDLLRELMLYQEASPFVMTSLSIHEFERFVHLNPGQALDMLSDLHSLVNVTVADEDGFPELQIVLHHKSFSDYLQDPSRSTDLHLQNHAVYTRLLRYTLIWLSVMNYETLDATCKGPAPGRTFDITEQDLQIARFCLCNWPVYLFKSLMMDIGPVGQSQTTLTKVLLDFFASDGWDALKAFVRKEGLLRCSPQQCSHSRAAILEDIWSWYLSQCLTVGGLPASQAGELKEMLSCLEYSRDHSSSDPMPKQRLNPPIVVQRGGLGFQLPGEFHPSRCIEMTLPPSVRKGSVVHARPERERYGSDKWSGPGPQYDGVGFLDGDEGATQEPEGLTKHAGLPLRASDSLGSSMGSEYFSWSSHSPPSSYYSYSSYYSCSSYQSYSSYYSCSSYFASEVGSGLDGASRRRAD